MKAVSFLFIFLSGVIISIVFISMHVDAHVDISVMENGNETEISYKISNFSWNPVIINGSTFYKITLSKEPNIMENGMPDLPKICRSIIIPDDRKMAVELVNASYREYDNVSIAPSKGIISREINPEDVPYKFGNAYKIDGWYPKNLTKLDNPYILRDFRGDVVEIYPFQYNAVEKKLRFYDNMTIRVYPVGYGGKNVYDRKKPISIDKEFEKIYKEHFINFDKNKYTPVGEHGNMLVVCYDNFYYAMKPFVRWKNMEGVPTEIVNFSSIGSNANDIKNYIVNYYNTHGLTFVLLVGDVQQIPTLYSGGGASDTSYSYIVGNDHYPDLFVGRFSAQNLSQVETQVNRTIFYEKYPQQQEWYHKGVGIASNQGPGDDGEYDWQHIRNIRSDLLGYYYTYVDEFYDGSHGGGDADGNPSSSMVANALNEGRSIINYCGHGSWNSWSTSGFNINNVHSLTNDNMLPFIWSVACYNGKFDGYYECFAEAWMRAMHNGEPTGAIATFMSSRDQYWNPPMDAQDEMVDILVETYPDNIKRTIGGLSYNGCMQMNDDYGSAGYDMTDTWVLFGDPSLEVRTNTPSNMTIIHNSTIMEDATSFSVNVIGIKDALCALSRNGNLIASGYTDENGNVTLHFSPITCGNLTLVVTAYNRFPYITNISVIKASVPKISNISYSSADIGGYVNISCKIFSSVGLREAKINITFPNGGHINATMLKCGDVYYYNSTYNMQGIYSFFIYALDTNGNSNSTIIYQFEIGVAYICLNLHSGWNFITIPVENNYTASSLYNSIEGCNIILKWNNSKNDFDVYVHGSPYNFAIENGVGYFISVSSNTNFSTSNFSITSVNITLLPGWNSLGWFKEEPTNASSIYNSIPACNIVLKWNNSRNDFDVYVPSSPNFVIEQGDGFIVAVNQRSIWNG